MYGEIRGSSSDLGRGRIIIFSYSREWCTWNCIRSDLEFEIELLHLRRWFEAVFDILFRRPEWFYYFECTIITDIVTRENRFTRSKFELHFCTFADDSKQNVKCLVHFVEIQWTMITTCICIKRYAEESFTIAVAFIYSYRISLFHPIRIVSDSEPNEIKLNKWISRNRSPAIFISNEAIQSRSRCYVNTVAWITVEHSHYPNTY